MATTNTRKFCSICPRHIANHDRSTKCSLCLLSTHIRCLPNYDPIDIDYASNTNNHWTCPPCLLSIFPYNSIEDNNLFHETINKCSVNNIDPNILSNLIYNPFEDPNDDPEGAMDDIDPDRNYLNEV